MPMRWQKHQLQLARGAPLVGQLSLYWLNDFKTLYREFNKGIIALPWESQLQMNAYDITISEMPSFSTIINFDG